MGVKWIVPLAIATVNAVVKNLAMFGYRDDMNLRDVNLPRFGQAAQVRE